MLNREHFAKLIARAVVHLTVQLLGSVMGLFNHLMNPYLAIGIAFLGGFLAGWLEEHLFGLPPFGSQALRASLGSIPGIVTGITISVIQHWNHDVKFFDATSLPDWLIWSSGFGLLFASIKGFIPEKVWLRYWLTSGLNMILLLEPSEGALKKVASLLHDTNPSVRVGAANFFFWRARQGRPVLLALGDLISALLHDTKITRDPERSVSIADGYGLQHMVNEHGFPQNVSIAIAATIGAQLLHIPWEKTNLEVFRQYCHEILGQQEEDDEQIKKDARLYLCKIFRDFDT
jgi:hypothetical protein